MRKREDNFRSFKLATFELKWNKASMSVFHLLGGYGALTKGIQHRKI